MKRLFIIVMLALITLGAIQPLVGSGFFPMHDDTQAARVLVMKNALSEGQFPVRWVADLGYGYGYPLFNFYGPLPYYIGAALVLVGVPLLVATKLVFIVGIVLLSISTFCLVSVVWGTAAGLLAATLALYGPYHAVQIYVRGAVGEFWASAFIPFIILGIIQMTKGPTRKGGIVIGSVALSATILSHTLSGYVTVLLLLIGEGVYWLIRAVRTSFDGQLFRSHIMLMLLGLGISAFFWIPALFEMQFTSVAGQIGRSADFHNHFVCPAQLWESLWGFGGSIPGCVDGLSFKLGKLHIVIAGIGLLIWMRMKKTQRKGLSTIAICLLLWSLFLATSASEWFWEHVPGLRYVQYPWRFLSGATLSLALLSGAMGTIKPKLIRWIVVSLCIVVVIMVNAKWFRPKYLYVRDAKEFETTQELRFRVSKISDEYLPPSIDRPTSVDNVIVDTIALKSGLVVTRVVDTATYARFLVSANAASGVMISRAYFPGWHYAVNTKPVRPLLEHGLPSVPVLAGVSIVEMRFSDTPVRTVANILSLASSIALVIFYVKTKKTNV